MVEMGKEADNWMGCYEGGWQGLIVPEAFSHPAKFRYNLTERMIGHAYAKGWVKKGSVIVDPFGGVGSGGIVAAYSDLVWIGCELEARFVSLAKQNFELHRHKWEKLNCTQPVIIQGDSRKLCEVIAGADCVISSPPYAGNEKSDYLLSDDGKTRRRDTKRGYQQGHGCFRGSETYGQTPGQLGSMRPGQLADVIVSSPPYAETLKGDGTQSETAEESRAKRRTEGGSLGQSQRTQGYGSKGNLGNLKPGDPPEKRRASVDCVVSSPPFEDSLAHKMKDGTLAAAGKNEDGTNRGGSLVGTDYGQTAGNIGNDKGPTFWESAKTIVQQCHQILKPGGHAIWVVKAFVRKGKRVDFPGDWERLCCSVGFVTVCRHRAMLVEERTHEGLFEPITEKKDRKSFYKRLAESKGSPRVDFEMVLCMEKLDAGATAKEIDK